MVTHLLKSINFKVENNFLKASQVSRKIRSKKVAKLMRIELDMTPVWTRGLN